MTIRTRFAPSPTGPVHIGNIRVAMYNWLFARHEGGQFLLRVEDTDRERSTPEARQILLEALNWLGLESDEEPVYQSARRDAHLEAAEQLLSAGLAYKDDKGGKGECVVFRMPGHDMAFEDLVRGPMKKAAADMQDFVIVRSNGSPVFHLANVVDDMDMRVTHVIRGDDHIENTYRHLALYEALGADVPRFAHLPMIVNAQGKPYSKRDGDAYVGEYREQGFLPEALFNALALLGWSPGDDREVMTRDEMIEAFDLEQVQSSAAQFDRRKLEWLNGEHLRRVPREDYLALCQKALEDAGLWADSIDRAYFERVIDVMAERIRNVHDVPAQTVYFFSDTYPQDEKAVRKRLRKEGARDALCALRERWAACDLFDAEQLEASLKALAEEQDQSPGLYIHAARVAVSGSSAGPGLYDMMVVLGRDRVLARMDRALAELDA